MTYAAFIEAVTPFITIGNAREYAAQTDKYLWVIYNILDEVEIRANDARVSWVEDALEALLAANALGEVA